MVAIHAGTLAPVTAPTQVVGGVGGAAPPMASVLFSPSVTEAMRCYARQNMPMPAAPNPQAKPMPVMPSVGSPAVIGLSLGR